MYQFTSLPVCSKSTYPPFSYSSFLNLFMYLNLFHTFGGEFDQKFRPAAVHAVFVKYRQLYLSRTTESIFHPNPILAVSWPVYRQSTKLFLIPLFQNRFISQQIILQTYSKKKLLAYRQSIALFLILLSKIS